MKKISLVLLASIFSLGVFAQTAPTAPKTTVAPSAKPATTTKKDNTVVKNNSKKATPTKKVNHQMSPAPKTGTAIKQAETQPQDLKK